MKLLAPGIIVVPAVVHAMIVSIDSTLSGQQSIYYYGSNPRRFIWLLPPQNYAGLAADTAFQINLSVSPSNISTNQSMFMAIYTAAQQSNIFGTPSVLNPDKFAWPAFKRYELPVDGMINKSLTISKKGYYYPALIVPFTDKAIKYQGRIAYRGKDGSYLSTDDRPYMQAMLVLTVIYTAVATGYTVMFVKSPALHWFPLPRSLLFAVWCYALSYAAEFSYYCAQDIMGYQLMGVHYLSVISKAAGESWIFVFAQSISIGWSLLLVDLDGKQASFMAMPLLYFIAGVFKALNGTSDAFATILLIMIFFRLVVCFWIYVSTHALAMICRQRTAAVDQSQNLTDKRQLFVLVNAYFRLRFLIAMKNMVPAVLLFPVLALFLQVLFIADNADRWTAVIPETVAILWLLLRSFYLFSPRAYNVTGSAVFIGGNNSAAAKPPRLLIMTPNLFQPRLPVASDPAAGLWWSFWRAVGRIALWIIYPSAPAAQ